ncbi:MAG: DNA-processing protein DprA [Gemmatimonadales bacterium]
MTGSREAYVALALVPGIGRARLDVLLSRYRTANAVLSAPFDALRSVPGISPAAATAIAEASPANGERVLERTAEQGGTVLTPSDDAFPASLRTIPDAPTLLFAKGRLDLLDGPAVAIIGSRTHTRYGAQACRHFSGGLARAGLTVVSGMARGLDAVAHEACLDAAGGTVGVLGNGLGRVYPAANRRLYDRVAETGCLLTEFPPGERPNAGSFPRRNRLIAGLARVTLVIEARGRSGTLITVDCALQQGKEVLAVPGQITSPTSLGCNRLIQQGAKPALGLKDVLEEYGLAEDRTVPAKVPNDLSDGERHVLDLLELGVEHVDDVAARLGGSVADALALLTGLEIRGLVSQEPGKVFRRVVGMT